MAWSLMATVPMFPQYYDFGVGSTQSGGNNGKTKWKIKNNSSNRTIRIRIAIRKSGSSGAFDETYHQTYTIEPGAEWYLSNVTYYVNAGVDDSFGVMATAYDDYPHLSVFKDVDTQPTMPPSLSVSGSFETGKVVTASWGISTDPEGDSITYSVEVSRNGGTYAVAVNTSSRSMTYTIPSGTTSLALRVRALANGLYSEYRTSPTYTVTTNTAPTITATAPSGPYSTKPSFNYTVSDANGDKMTITESIDGIVFNTRTGVASGTLLTFTPNDLAWLRTRIKQSVNITIKADDGKGGVTTVNYPITRTTPAIDMQLKAPFETDVAAKRLLLKLEGSIPGDSVINVQVCNNAFDASPTWENATNLVLSGFPYPFNNTIKTASKWGISFKIRIERGSSTQSIYLEGIGGAFD